MPTQLHKTINCCKMQRIHFVYRDKIRILHSDTVSERRQKKFAAMPDLTKLKVDIHCMKSSVLKTYFAKPMNQLKTVILHARNQLIIIICYPNANINIFAVWY